MSRVDAVFEANLQGPHAAHLDPNQDRLREMEKIQAKAQGRLPVIEYYDSPTFENRSSLAPLQAPKIEQEVAKVATEIRSILGTGSAAARLLSILSRVSSLVDRIILNRQADQEERLQEVRRSADTRRSLSNASATASALGGFGGLGLALIGIGFPGLSNVASLANTAANASIQYFEGQKIHPQELANYIQSKLPSDRQNNEKLNSLIAELSRLLMGASQASASTAREIFQR